MCGGVSQALERRVEYIGRAQASLGVQQRAEAHLDVADTFCGVVEHALVRDPFERIGVLHDREGDREAFQILLERGRIVDDHVFSQRLGVGRGQRNATFPPFTAF